MDSKGIEILVDGRPGTPTVMQGCLRTVIVFLALLSAAFGDDRAPAVSSSAKAPEDLFANIGQTMTSLEQITGWKAKHPVHAEWISKPKLRAFVEKRLKEEAKPEEMRIEQLTLRMFGLVPPGFDLRASMVDLVTEQAAAFYDYNQKRLFVLDTEESDVERRITLAHELAHALADQRFSLKKYMKGGMSSDDATAARQAVVEGQATWLMWAFLAARNGKVAEAPAAVADLASKVADGSSQEFPVLTKAPLYIRETMMFPYTKGLQFQDAIYKKHGQQGFTQVFDHGPLSTQQILHPDIYEANTKPVEIKLEAVDQMKKYRELFEGSVGELDHQILLTQYFDEKTADEVAPKWRGGAMKLYETKQGKQPLMQYASAWDNEETAKRYFTLYRTLLGKKWTAMRITRETADEVRGVGEYGPFRLWREGPVVFSIEGGIH